MQSCLIKHYTTCWTLKERRYLGFLDQKHFIANYKNVMCIVLQNHCRISSNKRLRRWVNFEALRCDSYWRAVLKRGRHLLQSKKNYSYEILKLCNFLSVSNNKQPSLWYLILYIPCIRTNMFFPFFIVFILVSYLF